MQGEQFRRRLISFKGYKGFKDQLSENEVLVVEFEAEDSDWTQFKEIKTGYDFRLVNKTDGNDLYGIWAWNKGDWEACDGKPAVNEFYHVGRTKTSSNRFIEDIVIVANELGTDAAELAEGVTAERLTRDLVRAHVDFEK